MDCAGRLVSPQSSSDQAIGAMRGQGIRTSDCLGKLRRIADELESAVRRLRHPQEAPSDRDFVVQEAQDAQDQPTDSREVFGPRPVRFRSSSSRIWRSRTQCRLFSIAQRFRMAVKTSYGGLGIYVGLGPTSKVRFLLGFGEKTESFAKRLAPDVTKCWYLQQVSDVLLHEPIRSNHSARPCRRSDQEARNHALVRP